MASMSGLHGSSQPVFEGSLQLSGSFRFATLNTTGVDFPRTGLIVRGQQVSAQTRENSRRAVLGMIVAGVISGPCIQTLVTVAEQIPDRPPRLMPDSLHSAQSYRELYYFYPIFTII
ncbi:oxygen-evolving enhancer protein 3, chloroplastic-like [Silene latifolia]|uniref:oxygen-evolving enhancer protein 3, chloroplastic-like n=1 Tax=Silene latifolia TaxID=37657 RepID=UPI003D77841D